ncbi:translation initiation factor IF-2-like [Cricetulus griseus]|uniref:translation initiation factor IF-2-like n=1 Tax=Cricetulus griseus TaxID=10029 RepID=UPI0015C2E9EB|nr:translation initiation factor IF-2-like [Cricetulus griseus]
MAVRSSVPATPWTTPTPKNPNHVGKGVQRRRPGQPHRAVLSHAAEPATARPLRTLQLRPEVEGKHGSVPGRRLPRAAALHTAGPRPHLTRRGPNPGPQGASPSHPAGPDASSSGYTSPQAARLGGDLLGRMRMGGESPGNEPREAAGPEAAALP